MKRTKSRCVLGACIGALAMVAIPTESARAADPPVLADGSELLAQARDLYVEGTRAVDAGQWEKARLFFLSAWRAQHHWQIAANLGTAEAKLERYRDAAEHLWFFLRETRNNPNVGAQQRADVQSLFDLSRSKVGALAINVAPAGAEVSIDGTVIGRAPLTDPIFVEPGRHLVGAHGESGEPLVEPRVVAPGGTAAFDVTLASASHAAPAASPSASSPSISSPAAPLAPLAQRAPVPPEQERTVYKSVLIGGAAASVTAAAIGAGLATWSGHLEQGGYCHTQGSAAASCEATWAHAKTGAVWSFASSGVLGLATLAYGLAGARRAPAKSGTTTPAVSASAIAGPGAAAGSISFSF